MTPRKKSSKQAITLLDEGRDGMRMMKAELEFLCTLDNPEDKVFYEK